MPGKTQQTTVPAPTLPTLPQTPVPERMFDPQWSQQFPYTENLELARMRAQLREVTYELQRLQQQSREMDQRATMLIDMVAHLEQMVSHPGRSDEHDARPVVTAVQHNVWE